MQPTSKGIAYVHFSKPTCSLERLIQDVGLGLTVFGTGPLTEDMGAPRQLRRNKI